MSTDEDKKTMKPSEQRTQQRRRAKQQGRTRRAELLLKKQADEKERQDALEDRIAKLEQQSIDHGDVLEALLARVSRLENNG